MVDFTKLLEKIKNQCPDCDHGYIINPSYDDYAPAQIKCETCDGTGKRIWVKREE